MKIPLWSLVVLLACVLAPGRADCQGECVACGLLLQQQQLHQAFNTMVCLLECEGQVSPPLTWEACKQLSPPADGALLRRAAEGLELAALDLRSHDGEGDDSAAAAATFEQRSLQYDSSLLEDGEEPAEEEEEEAEEAPAPREEREAELGAEDQPPEAVSLSKRFGGFQRGRHGYRKLISSPVRLLQKRYGGFIGVRKSARKWNNQKRVNQLLRQYLGMRSSRSGRFNPLPVNRVWRQNKL